MADFHYRRLILDDRFENYHTDCLYMQEHAFRLMLSFLWLVELGVCTGWRGAQPDRQNVCYELLSKGKSKAAIAQKQITESMMPGQCDAGPTATFPATEHHHPLTGTKLYCLVNRGTCVNNLSTAQSCHLIADPLEVELMIF